MKEIMIDKDSIKLRKRKEECVVSSLSDINDYPVFGDKPKGVKKMFKIKIKKPGLILISSFLAILLVFIFLINVISSSNFKTLKKNYSKYVITTEDATLYNASKKEVGSINEGLKLVLTDIKKLTKKNKYLKIDGTNYYIYYKDIKKSTGNSKEENPNYYISSGKSIKGEGKIQLYKDDKVVVVLKEGIEATLNHADDEYYYINYLNDTFKVKKTKNISEIQAKKVEQKVADHVSIIYYDLIDDNGVEDTCTKVLSAKAQINKIKDAGYYSITKDDYISYINGYTNLKENAVLFAIGTVNDNSKALEKELGISFAKFEESDGLGFAITNKTTTPKDDKNALNIYRVKKYYVIDDYVKMAAGLDVPDVGWQTFSNQGISVVNYHFFYDPNKDECNETICLEESKFREHLQWLQDNDYKTLTIKEFDEWMDGIIELPEKSVLLTIDDGAKGTGKHNGNILIPLLEEYKMHATLFLITGWWDIANYQSKYLDVQSHTNNLHYEATCSDGRGKVACSNYQEVYDDLKASIDIVKDKTSFCFPFYSYDRESLQAVEDLGFKLAFIGGNTKARRSNNKYLIPRYPILSDISLNEFANIVD